MKYISKSTLTLAKTKGFIPRIISEWGITGNIYEEEVLVNDLKDWLREKQIISVEVHFVFTSNELIELEIVVSSFKFPFEKHHSKLSNSERFDYYKVLEEGLLIALNKIT